MTAASTERASVGALDFRPWIESTGILPVLPIRTSPNDLQITCLASGLRSNTCSCHVRLRYCQGCFYHCHAAQRLVGLYT
jgi:hypothetical protein